MQDIIAALAYTNYAKEHLIRFAIVLVDHFVRPLCASPGQRSVEIQTLRAPDASRLLLTTAKASKEEEEEDNKVEEFEDNVNRFVSLLESLMCLRLFLADYVLPNQHIENEEQLKRHQIQSTSFLHALGLHWWPRFYPVLQEALSRIRPKEKKKKITLYQTKVIPNLRHFLTKLQSTGLMPAGCSIDRVLGDIQPVEQMVEVAWMEEKLLEARTILLHSDAATCRVEKETSGGTITLYTYFPFTNDATKAEHRKGDLHAVIGTSSSQKVVVYDQEVNCVPEEFQFEAYTISQKVKTYAAMLQNVLELANTDQPPV